MSRLVAIGHDLMVELNIPKAAARGYSINNDSVRVDRRRLLRHIRRAKFFPCARPLRAWWLDKLRWLARQ